MTWLSWLPRDWRGDERETVSGRSKRAGWSEGRLLTAMVSIVGETGCWVGVRRKGRKMMVGRGRGRSAQARFK